MTEIDKIKRQIKAMLSLTVENGATEGEAIAAANKAAELMLKWDLALHDLDEQKKETFKTNETNIDLNMETALVRIGSAIAGLCQCRFVRNRSELRNAFFFGEEQDSDIALYLMQICTRAIRDESVKFDNNHILLRKNVRHRKRLGFLDGMSNRLAQRIIELKDNRFAATGTSIVVSKLGTVDENLNAQYEMGGKIKHRNTISDADAAKKGKDAANRVPLNPGVESSGNNSARINP